MGVRRARHDCQLFPAWGTPVGYVPPADASVPPPVAPTHARSGPLPEAARTRHPCRVLPALSEETIRAYAKPS